MTARCAVTDMVEGTCAEKCCRPDLAAYRPTPEVWMRNTEAASNLVVLPLTGPSEDEMTEGLFEAAVVGEEIDLVDMVRELCESTKHRQPYITEETAATRYHSSIAPPLILQLLDAVEPPTTAASGSGSARVAASRPAAAIDAIDTAFKIAVDSARWCRILGLDDIDDTIPLVRRLLPHAFHNRDLKRDIQRWWTWARVITGWDRPAWQPANTCPICGVRGTLRVRVVERLATCTGCRETWDDLNIGLLAEHIQTENHEHEQEPSMAAQQAKAEEAAIGAGVLDVLADSEWLHRHSAAVAQKVLDEIREAHPVVAGDLDLVNGIRAKWGITGKAAS